MNRRRGAILILVLFVMVILGLLAVSFTYRAALARRGALDRVTMIRLRCQAASAATIAIARLAEETNDFDHPAEAWCSHPPLSQDGWLSEWSDASGPEGPQYQADYQVSDEEGRLHVLLASSEAMGKLGMSDDRIAALFDWMDEDDVARSDGAEDAYYESLPRPYRCKNAPLESMEELRMVRGLADDGPGPGRRWSDVLTCAGDGKINLNTAPVEVLRTLPVSDQAVGQIVGYRSFDSDSDGSLESHAFVKNDDIEQLQGLTEAERAVLTTLCKFRSDYFRITVSCRQASRRLDCRLEVLVKAQPGKQPEVLEWNFAG